MVAEAACAAVIDVERRRFSHVGGWPALRGWADAQAAGAGRTGMPAGSVAPFLNYQFTRIRLRAPQPGIGQLH